MKAARAIAVIAALQVLGCPPSTPPAIVEPVAPRPTTALPEPAPAPSLPPDAAVGVAAFFEHSCVLRQAGNADCWGGNTYGQLGNRTLDDSAQAVAVQGIVDAVHVAVGRDFSCALRRGGAISCWGNNEDGQLGDGGGVKPGALSLEAVAVQRLANITQISLGEYHACALDEAGDVSCWGNAGNGQVGSDAERAFNLALPIEQLKRVREVASGANHVCALEQRGTVKCWGRNTEGQLGDGVRGSKLKPVDVAGLDDAVHLGSGNNHTCAVREDGTLVCWGDNKSLQLGAAAGSDRKRVKPVDVPGVRDVKQVAGGDEHTCALLRSGRVLCWGANARGQLGHEEEGAARAEPKEVKGLTDATQLSLGAAYSCAVRKNGEALCWGAHEMP